MWIYVGKNLNYSQPILEEQIRKIYFLHYAGKSKPWSIKRTIHPMARYYQEIYFQLHKKRYHISSNWKAIALVDFIGILFSKTFKIVNYKISFIVNSLRYLFTKNEFINKRFELSEDVLTSYNFATPMLFFLKQ